MAKKDSQLEKFSNFVIFQTENGKVNIDVFFQNETLWLTQKKIAELFEVNVPAVSKHLKNIFAASELQENSVVSILETTAKDGKNYKWDLRDVHKKANNYLLNMEKLAVHQFIIEKYITQFTFSGLKL